MANASDISKVDHGAMAAAGKEFEEKVGMAFGELKKMDGTVSSLTSAWQGEASGKFSQVLQEWMRQFGIVVKSLDAMKDTLQGSKVGYEQGEYEVQGFSSKLDAALHGSGLS
ncbi:WXG100 family type VII secretion target [Streptomyces sp. 8N616]|uniref:WXG100 family type VII secretion target n=1 Tax=Streptomyces sp. 8N616 TaxID=3457414 RepID=UPI003FCFBC4E